MKYLVVGGSSGIGLSVVKRLSDQGHDVLVWARRDHPDFGRDGVQYRQVDITQDLPENIDLPEKLDGVFYAPGSITLAPFRGLKIDTFRSDYEINVIGAVRVLQAVLPAISGGHGSSVVFVSTVAGTLGMNFHASIAAAKAGVEGLARSLAAELAGKQVRVNVVAPSLTDTPLAAKLLDNEKKRERSAERHPLKRTGKPEDIAGAVCFLLSRDSGWITGQVLGIDGGLSRVSGL